MFDKLRELQVFNRQVATVVIVCVALTTWIYHSLDQEPTVRRESAAHTPDSYMSHFAKTDMDAKGAIKSRLEADFMNHFPDDGSTELVRPRLSLYNGKPEPWQATSETGWSDEHQDIVMLSGEVRVWRNDAKGAKEIEIVTKDARVFPQTREAETDAAITINLPNTVITSDGARANFNTNRVQLLSKVRSRHVKLPKT